MWTTQASAISQATPETIWALYANVPNWKRWDDAIVTSHVNGAFAPSSTGAMTVQGNLHPLAFTLLEVLPNILFRDVTEIPGANIEFTHTLERTAEGTRITHQVSISGPAWEGIAASVGQGIAHGLPHTVASLARLAEALTPA